jgi:hypothetical protein
LKFQPELQLCRHGRKTRITYLLETHCNFITNLQPRLTEQTAAESEADISMHGTSKIILQLADEKISNNNN